MKNKFNLAGKILASGVFWALLLTGCWNGLSETGNSGDGNVTVTVETGNTARTLRPNDITGASVFERIEVTFTKGDELKILTLNNGKTTGAINLGQGTWNVDAQGFIKIDDREYEAAQGFSSVTVGTGSANVALRLETGIFDGKPGVFNYTISFPASANEAVLEINPLNNLYGYGTSNTGKTVNLISYPSGSFELSPGYYLLNLTARSGNTMAVWSELVHIYSGQETAATHTIAETDFVGSLTLSGFVYGGALDGKHIEKAIVTAYGDTYYLNRIVGVEITNFSKQTTAPYYYQGAWSLTVPSTLAGKQLYFLTEETIETDTKSWDADPVSISTAGNTDIKLYASYTWGHWVNTGGGITEDAISYSVGNDGTVTVTTTQYTDYEWEHGRFGLWMNLPLKNDFRYIYEFDAWTVTGERNLEIYYIDYPSYEPINENRCSKQITINSTQKTFTIVSDKRIDPKVKSSIAFHCASDEVTGTFYIKMKSIKTNWEYVAPDPSSGPRWKAEPKTGGIHFTINLKDLPDYIDSLVIRNETNGSLFAMDLERWDYAVPDSYEVIFPYVTAGKDYIFSLGSWNDKLAQNLTVKAVGGRGELNFSNKDQLLLLQEGNIIRLNKTPVLSITEPNAEDERYVYELMTGTSWAEPSAEWRTAIDKTDPNVPINLLDPSNFPEWANPAEVLFSLAGKTSFATVFYTFDYEESDIYPADGKPGFFRTDTVASTPFTYPRILTGVFTAVPCPEGVKFTVDKSKIPFEITWLQFHTADWSAQCGVWYHEWENDDGIFYGKDKIEIVFPFVIPGKTYQFGVQINDTGAAAADVTVTPNAGLGEVKYPNTGNIGLIYKNTTKTLTFNGVSAPTVRDDTKITKKYWEWQFYKGHNWDDNQWVYTISYEELTPSITLDNTTITSWITDEEPWVENAFSELSGKSAFVQVQYIIEYDGRNYSFEGISSPPFIFPNF